VPIDIDTLTEAQLIDLNRRIVQRLRTIRDLRAHTTMLYFSIGDRVAFDADGRRVAGTLTRYNRKTVTIISDDGAGWNVSPTLLTRLDADDPDFTPQHDHHPGNPKITRPQIHPRPDSPEPRNHP
jgi:hypothetical protein